MKKIAQDTKISVLSRHDIQNLTRQDIKSFTIGECEGLTYDQLDWFSEEQLSYFTSMQKKVFSINIATQSLEEIRKINLNALSDVELKSLQKRHVEALTFEQIISIQPYIWHKNRLCVGTIGNFRPKQYSFFSTRQIRWMTMYQSANIPKQYLSEKQLRHLPRPRYEFPPDHFELFIHKDDVPTIDVNKLTILHIKYMSKFTLSRFTPQQIASFPVRVLHSIGLQQKYNGSTHQDKTGDTAAAFKNNSIK